MPAGVPRAPRVLVLAAAPLHTAPCGALERSTFPTGCKWSSQKATSVFAAAIEPPTPKDAELKTGRGGGCQPPRLGIAVRGPAALRLNACERLAIMAAEES